MDSLDDCTCRGCRQTQKRHHLLATTGNNRKSRSKSMLVQMKRHFKRFMSKDPDTVLDRYEKVARNLCPRSLQTIICHISAWVALLPSNEAVKARGQGGFSPVSLLLLLLTGIHESSWNSRLTRTLKVVQHRLFSEQDCLRPVSHHGEEWLKLRKCLQVLNSREPDALIENHFGKKTQLFFTTEPSMRQDPLNVSLNSCFASCSTSTDMLAYHRPAAQSKACVVLSAQLESIVLA